MAFSPSDAAFEGFHLTRRSPLTIVIWSLLYIAMIVAIAAIAGSHMAGFMEAAAGMDSGGQPSNEDMSRFFSSYAAMMGLVWPVSLILGAVIYAAVNRAVVRPNESAFGYLRLGMDEVRVAVVYLALSILGGLAFLVVYMAGIALGVAIWASLADSSFGVAILLCVLVGIAALAVIVWLSIRFSLAMPITVAERRIAIFDSWGLTKGRFWGLLGMNLLAFVMAVVVQMLASIIVLPVLFFTLGGFENLESIRGMAPLEIFQTMAPFAIAAMVFYGIVSALQTAIVHAPSAAAYLGIKGLRTSDSEELAG